MRSLSMVREDSLDALLRQPSLQLHVTPVQFVVQAQHVDACYNLERGAQVFLTCRTYILPM